MGFYGNITNTSKTTFSFDKTYANRYEMDLGCASDGIMSGRYVLVEYDQDFTRDSYSDYYCYDGKMYKSIKLSNTNQDFIVGPDETTLYQNPTDGEIVRVPKNCKAVSLNQIPEYVKVTSTEGGKSDLKFITQAEYEFYLNNIFKNITLDAATYYPGFFYRANRVWQPLLNDYSIEYTKEDTYVPVISKGTVSAEELIRHTDAFISGVHNDAEVDQSEVWYAYVEEDKVFAPLGHTADTEQVTDKFWRDWWEEKPSRKELFEKLTTVGANDDDSLYYVINTFDENAIYALPLSQCYTNVTDEVTQETYIKGFYYVCADDEATMTSQFALAKDNYNENQKYFINGLGTLLYLTDNKTSTTLNVNDCHAVLPFHAYFTNANYDEYWMYDANSCTWQELAFTSDTAAGSSAPNTYLTNFAIDMGAYHSARGYDSTVWQKVFDAGIEKYVMIAELNSVVPTFDIGVDAPTLLPIAPHFDADSTNVYYKLHWQPQWGFRVKAASNALKGPAFDQSGQVKYGQNVNLRRRTSDNRQDKNALNHVVDDVYYPSDQTISWMDKKYNTRQNIISSGYYREDASDWDGTAEDELAAAIYYNKDGFDPKNISYSEDLIATVLNEQEEEIPLIEDRYNSLVKNSGWDNKDSISITPTGQSGNLYNTHGNTTDQEPCEDTQELSIMLPSLGDTVAKIWDLIYGGRETNSIIKRRNERNTDVSWENARTILNKRGLRLVHANNEDGNAYSTAEINTVAGAINSAHDIIGMIIDSRSKESLESNLKELREDRIYYCQDNNKYYRKTTGYTYSPFKDGEELPITYEEASVTEDNWDPTNMYKVVGNEFVKCDPNESWKYGVKYYIVINEKYDKLEAGSVIKFDNGTMFYIEDTGDESIDKKTEKTANDKNFITGQDYIPGKTYFKFKESSPMLQNLTQYNLQDAYRPNKFFKKDDKGNYTLADELSPIPGEQYYVINPEKVVKVLNNKNALNFDAIYTPGRFYYKDEQDQITVAREDAMVSGRVYYQPIVKKVPSSTDVKQEYIQEAELVKVTIVPTKSEFDGNQNSVNAEEGSSFYYIKDEDDKPQPYDKSWKETVDDSGDTLKFKEGIQLYYYKITYKPISEQDTWDITMGDLQIVRLVQYTDNTFYTPTANASGLITGYKLVDKNLLNLSNENVGINNNSIVAFGFLVDTEQSQNAYKPCCASYNSTANGNTNFPPLPFTIKDSWTDGEGTVCTPEDYVPWACKKVFNFYVPSYYHYIDASGSLILDTYDLMTPNRKYYRLNNAFEDALVPALEEGQSFFELNKFYLQVNDMYSKATAFNEDLYLRKKIYVVEDSRGILPTGMVWPPSATVVPDGVVIGTRSESHVLKEIPSFSKELNTMNGLLLKINQTLEFNNELTRDDTVVSGLMNQIKDMIYNIGKLSPKRFVTIDTQGRMVETDWNTRQSDSIKYPKNANHSKMKDTEGDIFETADTVADMRKQWISVQLDGNQKIEYDYDDDGNRIDQRVVTQEIPTLTIHHNFQAVKNTTSSSNMNDSVINNDTILLYTPIVDETGHVVGNNSHTLTLPYGYKTIGGLNSDSVADAVNDVKTPQSANTTQDQLTFAASNKWIKIDTATDDTVKIGHTVNTITETAKGNTDLNTLVNNNIVNTIILQDIVKDAAGHITAIQNHPYTLPYGFKKISIGSQSTGTVDLTANQTDIIADNTQDTLTVSSGNKWVKFSGSDTSGNNLTVAHMVGSIEKSDKNNTNLNDASYQNVDTITLQDIVNDEAGHITAIQNHSYTLPYGFKTISDGTNSTNATNTKDSLVISGSGVISSTVNSSNKTVTIAHGAPTAGTVSVNNETPAFGGTVTINDYSFDANGHKNASSSHTIKIPELALNTTSGSSGNLLTNISLSGGTFTKTYSNVGSLALTGYSLGTDKTSVLATDTINGALSKLQNQVNSANATHNIFTTCTEAIGNATKATADIATADSSFSLIKGSIIAVYFANGHSPTSLKLNLTGLGLSSAVNVYYKNSANLTSNLIAAKSTVTMIYNGSRLDILSIE